VKEPFWLNERMVKAMHTDQLLQHGGTPGIRDENLLSASLARPRHLFTYAEAPTLFDLAAAYGYGLAKNHPFIDGNKRTALVVMAAFLELNGYSLNVPEIEVVLIMERLATELKMTQESQESLAEWLEENSISL
jgi:death-on-curing protein